MLARHTYPPIALLVAVACVDPGDEAPATDFEIATKRVVLYGRGREETELCGGSIEWTERYIDSLAPHLDLPDGIIAQYFWHSDELFEKDGFCGDFSACTRTPSWSGGKPVIFSPLFPYEHELVHAAQMTVGVSSVPILEEGIAEFLGGVNVSGDDPGSLMHLLELSFTPDPSSRQYTTGDYARARDFVSFLVESYGLPTVLELCDAVPDGSTQADFDQASFALLGQNLDQLLTDYEEYPSCQPRLNRAKILECSREPVLQVGGNQEASFDINASCASLDAVGPRGGEYHISEQVRLLDDGLYTFELHHPDELANPDFIESYTLTIEQCAPCSEATSAHLEFPNGPEDIFGLDLNSGDYTLTFGFPIAEVSGASTTEVSVHVIGL